jgi:hypothetical protein
MFLDAAKAADVSTSEGAATSYASLPEDPTQAP